MEESILINGPIKTHNGEQNETFNQHITHLKLNDSFKTIEQFCSKENIENRYAQLYNALGPRLRRIYHKEALAEKVFDILDTYFLDRPFHFEAFAKVNGIDFDPAYKPHSDIAKHSFNRMLQVCFDLLENSITVDIGSNDNPVIKLESTEIIDAYNRVNKLELSNNEDKAYILYSILGELIHDKLLNTLKDNSFINDDIIFIQCLNDSSNLCKSILSLPLVNIQNGIESGLKLLKQYGNLWDAGEIRYKPTPNFQTNKTHQELIDRFRQLGIFCAFENDKLATEMLSAAQFMIKTGLKTPLFIAELQSTNILSHSFECNGILINNRLDPSSQSPSPLIDELKHLGFNAVHHIFYHESTHNVRDASGVLFTDPQLGYLHLNQVLSKYEDITSAIKSQIRDYALTNYEEYIAEFSARVLCCLEQNKNPFDYITDQRLWRLYYEFGGPDYTNVMIEKGFVNNTILSDKSDKWSLSGYPSKFNIDISEIENQQIEVEGMVAVGVKTAITINDKTILPPPPLGYRYTTDNKKLQLQDIASRQYYDPTFCSLTNGPLTLMKTNPQLVHHFELLKDTNDVVPNTTSNAE